MNIKKTLQTLNFQPKENSSGVFIKKYANNYAIQVDVDNETFIYGGKIKVQGKEFQKITKPEDWVVFECVNRLLEKGYKPENIILEKVYPSGHGTSGRLDICVNRDDGSEYLQIECKTYGAEYTKAIAKLKKDGGQLFTYFKFSNKADVIMLYASELKGNDFIYESQIVKIEEEYRLGDVKDFYDKWNKLTKDNGVFDSWVNPYQFISKALTPKLLQPIKQEDSSFIFNRFLEILRHNVVSDKPNAFNKIFTLFLCKIYDEKYNEDTENELGFQWLEGIDDDVSFQLRLTDLYKNGMLEFLEKKVTDFSETEFENKFKSLDDSVKAALLTEFKKIRLEKNNEFAIKEVYDEKSFKENAKVVKEVVELLQGYKIRYTKKQQYLSDFFELLLTTGLKQESGQFFTPVPIAQFIIKSLPIDKLVEAKLQKGEANNLLPFVMDYAAGSGHFLTETMHEVQRIIDKKDDKKYNPTTAKKIRNWKDDHFDWAIDYVYGIEKDYRLVKVGKVGCYLHGDGLANVIHSDGLAYFNHADYKGKLKIIDTEFTKENKQFEIIVSNPPYSVSSFKNASTDYYKEKDFDLYSKLTDNSSEIECLFIERTKQLLKDGGIAGIILPSSILSNTGIYTKSREIILQNFDVVAITELGSNTFMATGTNTVVLFLRRKNNYDSINIKLAVDKFFINQKDVTINGIEKPIAKYVNHVWQSISVDDYITLIKKQPNAAIQKHELYIEYKKKLKVKDDTAFWDVVMEKESEKLHYFIIAYPQKLVLVKSGEKDAEKRFLGYEFSSRRGSEGIHAMQRNKSIDECTQLFDADEFENPTKASTYIYKAFNGDYTFAIDPTMQNNITRHNLVDMLTFDRVDFEKNISLSVKKKVKIESKWEIVKVGEIASTQYGYTDRASDKGEFRYLRITDLNDDGTINVKNEAKYINANKEIQKQFLLKDNDVVIARSGSVGKSAIYKADKYKPMIFASYLIRLSIKEDKILPKYFFNFTKTKMYWDQVDINSIAVTQPNLNAEKIKEFQISLPPLNIQQKIVDEIETLEKKESKAKEEIEKLNINLEEKLSQINSFEKVQLETISKNLDSLRKPVTKGHRFKGEIPYYGASGIVDYVSEYLIDDYVLLISEDGANLKSRTSSIAFTVEGKAWVNNHAHILKFKEKSTHHLIEFYINRTDISEYITGQAQPKLNQLNLNSIKVPYPPLTQQQKIVTQIKTIEEKIAALNNIINSIPQLKEAILKKYL